MNIVIDYLIDEEKAALSYVSALTKLNSAEISHVSVRDRIAFQNYLRALDFGAVKTLIVLAHGGPRGFSRDQYGLELITWQELVLLFDRPGEIVLNLCGICHSRNVLTALIWPLGLKKILYTEALNDSVDKALKIAMSKNQDFELELFNMGEKLYGTVTKP